MCFPIIPCRGICYTRKSWDREEGKFVDYDDSAVRSRHILLVCLKTFYLYSIFVRELLTLILNILICVFSRYLYLFHSNYWNTVFEFMSNVQSDIYYCLTLKYLAISVILFYCTVARLTVLR